MRKQVLLCWVLGSVISCFAYAGNAAGGGGGDTKNAWESMSKASPLEINLVDDNKTVLLFESFLPE